MTQEQKKKEPLNVFFKELYSIIKIILFALILAIFVRVFVVNVSNVPTGSMIPTININDKIVVLQFYFRFWEADRGDIVVFKQPEEVKKEMPQKDKDTPLVKRVIAKGGETIEILRGNVYIDGELLDEPYVFNHLDDEDMEPFTVPGDCYFVMGDNRGSSFDCRRWETKYITKDMLMGRAVFRIGGF